MLAEVAAVLERLALPASFACIGVWAQAYPDAHRSLIGDRHEILGHTETHPWHDELGARRWKTLSDAEMAAEVADGRDSLARLGASVLGFRTPHFSEQHDARVYRAIERAGLRYSSSTVASEVASGGAPFRVGPLWEFPLLPCPAHPWLLLDSWHCTTAPRPAHPDPNELVALYRRALASVERCSAFGSVYWDPRAVRLPGYADVLDLIAERSGRLRLTTYRDLLDRH